MTIYRHILVSDPRGKLNSQEGTSLTMADAIRDTAHFLERLIDHEGVEAAHVNINFTRYYGSGK